MRINRLEPVIEPWELHAYAVKTKGGSVLSAKAYSDKVLQVSHI